MPDWLRRKGDAMKRKPILILALLLSALFLLQACSDGGGAVSPAPTGAGAEEELTLTLDELAQYDGKDGNPAYIAVDGVIYDVTDVALWKNGAHNGYTAGQDLTDEIKNISPHGVSKLKGLPVVGKLAE